MHPDMRYHLNVIRHHDRCRLVHPAKWDISSMPYAIMTDADWCNPQVGHWTILGCLRDGCRLVHPVKRFIRFFKYHISIPYSLYYLFKDILNLCTYFIYSFTYSFHILIHVLISYTHSCTHFIYSFMYSFHSYLVNYQNT